MPEGGGTLPAIYCNRSLRPRKRALHTHSPCKSGRMQTLTSAKWLSVKTGWTNPGFAIIHMILQYFPPPVANSRQHLNVFQVQKSRQVSASHPTEGNGFGTSRRRHSLKVIGATEAGLQTGSIL